MVLDLHGREKLKCIMVDSGTEFVILTGILMMLRLHARKLAFPEQLQWNIQELYMGCMPLLYLMELCVQEKNFIY